MSAPPHIVSASPYIASASPAPYARHWYSAGGEVVNASLTTLSQVRHRDSVRWPGSDLLTLSFQRSL